MKTTHLPPRALPRWSRCVQFLIRHNTGTTAIIQGTALSHNVIAKSTLDCTDVFVSVTATTEHICSHQPDPETQRNVFQ